MRKYIQKADLPRVAILLAAYNGMRWIEEQVRSIRKQEGVKVCVFISVDQSTDDTLSECQVLAKKDARVVLLPPAGRFSGAARNFFRLLRDVNFDDFDYVSFSDQDDIWLPDKLLRAHKTLVTTGADAYSSNVLAFWPNNRKILIEKAQAQVQWDFLFEAAGPGCTYVMRRDLACHIQDLLKNHWADVQQVGLHDWFTYAFARANGYRWVIDGYAGMLYRQHEENQVGVNSGIGAFIHRARKVLNGWGLTQSALIARLVGLDNDPFVEHWVGGGRAGILWLALHARQCRRRTRDQIIFAMACVLFGVLGSRRQ